ncbi:MAG TPA: DNA polymerase I, partial [Pyrinomonadaceae bacterium]|nr:DNA polymerase I [Pyrinomonadaceae bacterium]
MKRIFLIDSMSHIFRAYFAPMGMRQEPLRNSHGQVTQAVFVFTNMLRKLISDEKPDYIAAVFDSPEKTFRHESFADYKANRAEMPDDLAAQIPYIIRVCEVLNIPILRVPGFEADDIIGTLAKKAAEQKIRSVIVSNDKDLCQLVHDPLVVCMRQNSQNLKRKVPVPPIEYCDEAWVQNKFGVPPSKIIDLLGLMGDSIDNIPGAPGIGEKGALKLVLEFGSAEGAMANAEKVSHKTYRESLQNNQEIIRQSLELATIHTEMDLELDLDALKAKDPNRADAYALFRELEFSNLMREFADSAPLISATASADDSDAGAERRYDLITTRAELDKLVRQLWETEFWSFEADRSNSDDKASSFDMLPPVGVAIATAAGASHYVDLEHFAEGRDVAAGSLRDILSNGFLDKVTHDLKSQLASLTKLGITPEQVVDDTMIAAYVIDSGRKTDLESLAQFNLAIEGVYEVPDGWSKSQYAAAERADYAFQLAPKFRRKIIEDKLEKVYAEIEVPLVRVLFDMEVAGMKVDVLALRGFSEFVTEELESISAKIFGIAGHEFKINSPKQVGEVLQELNIETGRKTATGQISTSKDILAELAETYEIAQLIIDYRELDKLKATYSDVLPTQIASDGRIHGKLNQTVAATGRLSSTDPNLQNIPVRTELGQVIRRAFIPEAGNKLISADYSQLELRILAHITHDPVMMEAYGKGEDIHAKTAKLVFGATTPEDMKEKRRLAKIVNFGIAYAVEAFGLSQRVGISRSEAKEVIQNYYNTYKGIKKFMDETPEVAREQGYVTSIFGRRRYFPSINDRNYAIRSRAEREAINMPIQGSASDIVKIAMLKVDSALRREKLRTKMIMQVHDELLFESPVDEVDRVVEIVKHEMESAVKLDIPLIAEVELHRRFHL